MSVRVRFLLALVGWVVVLCALLALAYAFGQPPHVNEQVPIAPTFFAPPQSAAAEWEIE